MPTRTLTAPAARRTLATGVMAVVAAVSLAAATSGANATTGLVTGAGHAIDSEVDHAVDSAIDPAVLAELASARTTEFFVYLHDAADLSGAVALQRREAQTAHVFQELTTTAEPSQADLRTLLDERGITYTPFWIANTLLVEGDRSPSSGPRGRR